MATHYQIGWEGGILNGQTTVRLSPRRFTVWVRHLASIGYAIRLEYDHAHHTYMAIAREVVRMADKELLHACLDWMWDNDIHPTEFCIKDGNLVYTIGKRKAAVPLDRIIKGVAQMDRIEIDLRTTQLTMGELIAEVERRKAANPGREYVMDGDSYAIVSRERDCDDNRILGRPPRFRVRGRADRRGRHAQALLSHSPGRQQGSAGQVRAGQGHRGHRLQGRPQR